MDTTKVQLLVKVTEHINISEKYNLTVTGWQQIVSFTVQCLTL